MTTLEATLAGSTGLVGSHILQTLSNHPSITKIHAFTRKPLPPLPKLSALESASSETWPSLFPSTSPLFISALGTTRGQAGGFEAQYQIDHVLNVSLAKAAFDNGAKTYVLISSSGANPSSRLGYPRMKGETEAEVSKIGFERVVILRPGLIVGDREDSRPPEFAIRKIAGLAGMLGNGFKDFWAQDAGVIAKAAVSAGLLAAEGKVQDKVWILGQSDIVRLGRTEWKD